MYISFVTIYIYKPMVMYSAICLWCILFSKRINVFSKDKLLRLCILLMRAIEYHFNVI